MNRITSMPDAYNKDVGGNLYNLFELLAALIADEAKDLQDIDDSSDIFTASGDTLDRYGKMFGVDRCGATDVQYRTKILNRIGENLSTGDCNSVIRLIAQMLDVPESEIRIAELGGGKVSLSNIAFNTLEKSGFDGKTTIDMIGSMLPIGVSIGNSSFAGTFRYGTAEGETSTTTGYDCGTLGMVLE